MYRAKYSNARMKYHFFLELRLNLNVSHNTNLLEVEGVEFLDWGNTK